MDPAIVRHFRALSLTITAYICSSIQHCSQRQNDNNEFLSPHGPVQRVIGIFAGLRRQHNVSIAAGAMLKLMNHVLCICSRVVEEHGTRHVLQGAPVCVETISTVCYCGRPQRMSTSCYGGPLTFQNSEAHGEYFSSRCEARYDTHEGGHTTRKVWNTVSEGPPCIINSLASVILELEAIAGPAQMQNTHRDSHMAHVAGFTTLFVPAHVSVLRDTRMWYRVE